MISLLVREFLLPLLIFLLLRNLLTGMFRGMRGDRSEGRPASAPPKQEVEALHKDPVCGTYVAASAAVTRTVRGEVVHFCSKECSEKYR